MNVVRNFRLMVIVHLHCCIPDIDLATYNVACSSLGTPPWVKSGLMEQLLFSKEACACMRPRGPFKLQPPKTPRRTTGPLSASHLCGHSRILIGFDIVHTRSLFRDQTFPTFSDRQLYHDAIVELGPAYQSNLTRSPPLTAPHSRTPSVPHSDDTFPSYTLRCISSSITK